MKNWFKSGNLILLGGALFLVFIFTLLVAFIRQDLTLVTKDYYSQELRYDQKKLAVSNAGQLDSLIGIRKGNDSIELFIPVSMSSRLLSGQAYFYCPSDEKFDHRIDLQANLSGRYLMRAMESGKCMYILKIMLDDGVKEYYKEFKL